MSKYSYYPSNPELNRYAVILASMSPAMVEGIITLVNLRGRGLTTDLFASRQTGAMGIPAASAKPMAMFGPDYIRDNDFEDVYRGVMTLLISNIRKPRVAGDEYKTLLIDAFNIPDNMAEAIANKIETEDILKPLAGDRTWLDAIGLELNEAVRTAMNWGGGLINSPWEIDQKQNYDFDFLYEMKALGSAVDDLNSRASLITAQSMINAELSLFQMEYKGTGDIESVGDIDRADMMVGDIFGRLKKRALPANIAGGLKPLSDAGAKSAMASAKNVLDAAGYKVQEGGNVTKTTPKNAFIKQAVDKLINMKPSTAMALGAALGIGPIAIAALAKRGKGDVDDVMGDVYSDISTTHGPNLAEAWMRGDIDDMFQQCLNIADSDVSTGDPDLDEAIDAAAMEDEDGTEIGGPFKRFRVNVARRQAGRQGRKAIKKDVRQMKKNDFRTGLSQAKLAKSGQMRRPLVMPRNPTRSRSVPNSYEQDWTLEDQSQPGDDMMEMEQDIYDNAQSDDRGGEFENDYGLDQFDFA